MKVGIEVFRCKLRLRFPRALFAGSQKYLSLYFTSTPQGEGDTAGQGAIYFRKMWNEFKERRLKQDKSLVIAEFSQFDNPVNPEETIRSNMVNITQAQVREEVYGKFANYGATFFAGNYLDKAIEKGEKHICFFPKFRQFCIKIILTGFQKSDSGAWR